MIKISKKHILLYFCVPLMAAVAGSVVTLIFAPVMENIRFSYWKKQRTQEVNFILFEKRVDGIAEFQNANMKLRRCINKFTLPEYREDTGYIDKYCSNELDQIWGATFKAAVIYDEETINQINDLKESLFKLLMKSSLNMQDPTNYVDEVFDNLDKTLELLQTNLMKGIYN